MGKGFLSLTLFCTLALGAGGAGPVSAAAAPTTSVSNAAIVQSALKYLGYRYTTVGNSPKDGFSCIGFASYVYQSNGIPLPDDLQLALDYAPRVTFANLLPGDLIFFQNTVWNGLSHVAIYLGSGRFVHAEWYNRGVVISSFYNDPIDGNYWIHKYLGANRPWTGPAVATIPLPTVTPGPAAPIMATPSVATLPTGPGTPATVAVWLLNVRATPSKQSTVVNVIPQGTPVLITGQQSGWYHIRLGDGSIGWVVTAGLTEGTVTPTATPTPTSVPPTQTSAAGPSITVPVVALNLREGPSLQSHVITVLKQGDRVQVLDRSGDWAHVRTSAGLTGWVSSPLLFASPATPAPTPTATPTPRAGVLTVAVRVHSAPNLQASVVTVARAGTHVQVVSQHAGWARIRGSGAIRGYVVTRFVRLQ